MLPTHQITARTEIRGAVSAGSHGAAAVAAAGSLCTPVKTPAEAAG